MTHLTMDAALDWFWLNHLFGCCFVYVTSVFVTGVDCNPNAEPSSYILALGQAQTYSDSQTSDFQEFWREKKERKTTKELAGTPRDDSRCLEM